MKKVKNLLQTWERRNCGAKCASRQTSVSNELFSVDMVNNKELSTDSILCFMSSNQKD